MKNKIDASMYASLITLVFALFTIFGKLSLKGHRDCDSTLCPGDNLYALLSDLELRAMWHFQNTKVDCGSPLFSDLK